MKSYQLNEGFPMVYVSYGFATSISNGFLVRLNGRSLPKMSLCCTYRETRDPVCFFEMKRVQNASRESQNESQNDFFVRKVIHSSVLGRVWDASFVLERFPKRVPFILLGLVFGTRFNMRTTVGLGLVRHSSTEVPQKPKNLIFKTAFQR